MTNDTEKQQLSQKNIMSFVFLGLIFAFIISATIILQIGRGWNFHHAMTDFMGIFFIVFGSFKLINFKSFIDAFQTYDIIAKFSRPYATIYPFIEIGLGILYLIRIFLTLVNIATLILMIIGSTGVLLALRKKEQFQCACLGTIIDLPLTYVSLIEDALMGFMALFMLFF